MEYLEIQRNLKDNMKPDRYRHTMGVVETAQHLAEIHDCDTFKASLAGLLHDCAKHLGDDEKKAMCREYGYSITAAEDANPQLLHAKCGAILAEYKYGVCDWEILHSIIVHTTGVPDMNLLDKIIFVSDYIEPGRDKAPHLKELRKMADTDLDRTVYQILKDTVEYLNHHSDKRSDPTTVKAYNFYKELEESRP